MTTFFTSDLHLNHAALFWEYLPNRRKIWNTVEEMNSGLIDRWNARVCADDTVYCLGDFALGPKEYHRGFVQALKGHKHIVLGNHDRSAKFSLECGWESATKREALVVNELRILLAHHPREEALIDKEDFDYQLCGHVHEAYARRGRVINCGVDVREFEPKTLEELLA